MDVIRNALLHKFGKVPLLDTYRQMSIRQQKARNWAEALHWAERGLALYGDNAARPEFAEDLRKRATAYSVKLSGESRQPRARFEDGDQAPQSVMETLICMVCGQPFVRTVARGRKPKVCPSCR
jgi:rubrerythrin